MKKKKVGVIASSVAAIAVCSSMVVGSTFALFTSEDTVNIAVTSGKVAITANVVPGEVSSTLGEGVAAMGTMTETKTGLALNGIVPGDVFTFTVESTNTSTIEAWYRAKIEFTDATLASVLTVSVNEADYSGQMTYATEWTKLAAGEKPADLEFVVTLPKSVTGENFMGKSTEIKVTVEGVQGNATVSNNEELVFAVANAAQLEAAVKTAKEAEMKATIQLVDDIVLSHELLIDQHTADLTINGNGHEITAQKDFENVKGKYQLVKVNSTSNLVTLNGVTLKHVAINEQKDSYHTLDVWGSKVELNNVTLIRDFESAKGGAPLVINGSEVLATNLHIVADGSAWYGANVDAKNGAAKLTIDENFSFVDMGGLTDIRPAIRPENDAVVEDAAHRLVGATFVDGDGNEYDGFKVVVAKVGEQSFTLLNDAVAAVNAGGTIEVMQDVALTYPLYFEGKDITGDITLNGNGHHVTAASNFETNAKNHEFNPHGRYDLVKFDAVQHKVTINDLTLEHCAISVLNESNGKYVSAHTMDVYACQALELNNVKLIRDVDGKSGGAAMLLNKSTVVATDLSVVAGGSAWYGVNVDASTLTLIGSFTFEGALAYWCEHDGVVNK